MLIPISQLIIGSVDLVADVPADVRTVAAWASPVTAPSGILVAGVGMAAAILVSFLYVLTVDAAAKPHLPVNIALAAAALVIGAGLAWRSGRKVAITAMPQARGIVQRHGRRCRGRHRSRGTVWRARAKRRRCSSSPCSAR